MSNKAPIPDALLALLTKPWLRNADWSAFEGRYADKFDDPSVYHYQLDRRADESSQVFTLAEVRQLISEGVLEGLAKEHPSSIAVNEHAEHAISDFCSEVYRAWDKLNERLDAVRIRRPPAKPETALG